MGLFLLVIKNQIFHARQMLLVVCLVALMFFVPAASSILTSHVRELAERPLRTLQTELILQDDSAGTDAGEVRTTGIILPFNLRPFSLASARQRLAGVYGIKDYSTALVLWQFDLQNTLTIIALNKNEPLVGLRRIESFLMPGGRFFSDNTAREVILERHFAKLFKHKVNTEFTLAGDVFRIVGIVDFREQSNLSTASVFLPYETGLHLAQQTTPVINQVFLSLKSSAAASAIGARIAQLFPGYSLITKDSLYKNLSNVNRLLYRFGNALTTTVAALSFLLVLWIIKLHRLEFSAQTGIFQTIGWPRRDIRAWLFFDIGIIVSAAAFWAALAVLVLLWLVLPQLRIAPILNQGFTL